MQLTAGINETPEQLYAGELFGMLCSFPRAGLPDDARLSLQFLRSSDGLAWERFGPEQLFLGGVHTDPDGNPALESSFGFAGAVVEYGTDGIQSRLAAKQANVHVKLVIDYAGTDTDVVFDIRPAGQILHSGPLGHRSISYVQVDTAFQAAGGSNLSTDGMTTTSGNLIHIDSTSFDSAQEGPPTDNKGNTYTKINDNLGWSSSWTQKQAYAKNITGGSGHIFTQPCISFGSGYANIAAIEIAGAAVGEPLGKGVKASSNTISTGTLPQATGIIIACGQANGGSLTLDGAQSSIANFTGTVGILLGTGYQTFSATTSKSYTITGASSMMATAYAVPVDVIHDDFNRSDQTNLGTSSEGWLWSTGSLYPPNSTGTTDIVSNHAQQAAATDQDVVRAEIDLSSTDHYAQVELTNLQLSTQFAGAGVNVRMGNGSNPTYYVAYLLPNGVTGATPNPAKVQLYKYDTSTYTLLGEQTGVSWAEGALLRCEVSGNNFSVYLAGALQAGASVSDSSYPSGLRAGILFGGFSQTTKKYLDNFEAGILGGGGGPPNITETVTVSEFVSPNMLLMPRTLN